MAAVSSEAFNQFFRRTVRKSIEIDPFEYQRRLAEGETCVSRLIDVPTGCGKTAAVVLAWLWNRVELRRPGWPRRLAYCLPMRALAEQTAGEVKRWLGDKAWDGKSAHAGKVGVHVLMGGEDADAWEEYPEEDAILIGTQDMLISRALNRGYGMSRYRWPMSFGLLNNDCLWVMDETQLMGVAVETSAQLDAFRQKLGGQAGCHCWWMSATLETGRLATVDHPAPPGGWPRTALSEQERRRGEVQKRYEAKKRLAPATVSFASSNAADTDQYQKELAAFVAARHVPGTLTLAVVNRVPRAQAVYELLVKTRPGGAEVALIHSRFRPPDRAVHEAILFDKEGQFPNRIVVATQAVEAGVDVSARTLVTELAPWSSMVQRFGRCNRYGEWNDSGGAEIFWANVPTASDKDAAPYAATELMAARAVLETLSAAGPQDLQAVGVPEAAVVRPVLRRKDLLDLFDTTPDLCGADLDISRYVRDGEDTDVQAYWREIAEGGPSAEENSRDRQEPTRDELCRVGVGRFGDFIKSKTARVWRWNALEERWDACGGKDPVPGAVYLLATDQGGYHGKLGWTGNPKHRPAELAAGAAGLNAYGNDWRSFTSQRWVGLREHVDGVVSETDKLCAALSLPEDLSASLHAAAAWHDAGKAHEVFQAMLHADAPEAWDGKLLAKSGNRAGRCQRKGFRHELASALLWLRLRGDQRADGNLVAYLIGAHHGKVRLSIRALPDEEVPKPAHREDHSERFFARGVWQDDLLPAPGFGVLEIDGEQISPTPLDLSYMRLGRDGARGESWLARMIRLRDDEKIGPFRLAFLETLLRVADWRASASERGEP